MADKPDENVTSALEKRLVKRAATQYHEQIDIMLECLIRAIDNKSVTDPTGIAPGTWVKCLRIAFNEIQSVGLVIPFRCLFGHQKNPTGQDELEQIFEVVFDGSSGDQHHIEEKLWIALAQTESIFEAQCGITTELGEGEQFIDHLSSFMLERARNLTEGFMASNKETVDVIQYYVQLLFNLQVCHHALALSQEIGRISTTDDYDFILYSGPHATDKAKAITYVQSISKGKLRDFAQKVEASYDITRHAHYRT